MGEQTHEEPVRSPPGPQLHSIEERESSPNSSASTETLATSPKKHDDETDTPGPSKQQLALEQQHQQNSQMGPTLTPVSEQPPPLFSRPSMASQPTESGSVYYGQQTPSLANRTWSQQQGPTHSLEGNNMAPGQPQTAQQGNVYVEPEYRQRNPKYGRENEKPIWGLAKPLPRVVRPGMRRDQKSQPSTQQHEPPGESSAAPELGVTPGLSSPQPTGASQGQGQTYSSTAQQGLAKQHAVYAPQSDGLLRPMESEATMPHDSNQPNQPNQQMDEQPQEEFLNLWVKIRHHMKEPFAEFLATTVTVLIGLCGTLAVSTGGTQAGNRLSENWSWGLGSMIGIYLAGGISGAHLNPGISITLWIFRGFPGRRCCYYIVAQTLGAITAAGLSYCLYRDSILSLAPTASPGSSGLGFYTEPRSHVSSATAFFTEYVADAVLLCVIFAMGDDSNAPPAAGMHSFVIGLVIYVLCVCLGFNTGGVLNPVRDFGPRLVALMAGYGGNTFTDHKGWWFWGGWVATISGSLAGGGLYDTFIFIGGESPINYAPRRRHRAKLKKETEWRKRLGIGKEKIPDLEDGIKNLDD